VPLLAICLSRLLDFKLFAFYLSRLVWYQDDVTASNDNNNKSSKAGYRWLTPVILATQEAEIRRTAVPSQPRQILQETLS
jgi:hypothetical protein